MLEAWANYTPPAINNIYKVYYESASGDIIRTAVEEFNDPYIVVDRETFNSVVPNQFRVIDGKLVPRPSDNFYRKYLELDNNGKYTTIKNHAQFLVTNTDQNVDKWTVNYDQNN